MTNRSVLYLLTLFGGTPGALTPSALESTLVFSEISSARDAASLSARLPGVAIFGDWNGNLSRSGERLILRDLTRNVVDEIRYLDDGRWPAEADGGGNKVFHMATTGSTEHQHNHASTTLKVGGSFVATNSGSTYEISFRTKWLAGSNQIHTRLYFDRAAKTTLHDVPADGSNPGAGSSNDLGTWAADRGIADLTLDRDRDGYNHLAEFAFATDPFVANAPVKRATSVKGVLQMELVCRRLPLRG